MKNYSKEVFLQKLSEISFPNYTNFKCVSAAYEDFVNKLLGVIDMVAPLKEIRIKGDSKSWFDSDILERINIRERLRKKYKKSGLQIDFENFKDAQKQTKQLIKEKSVTISKKN